MVVKVRETDGTSEDFAALIRLLDAGLTAQYGELQKEYDKYNKLDFIKDAVVVYIGDVPVACGAFKAYGGDSVEMKRVFVRAEHRRQGLARLVMARLEELASSRGYKAAVLETGLKQVEAIDLYKSLGYSVIENYGPYVGNENSVCMRKVL